MASFSSSATSSFHLAVSSCNLFSRRAKYVGYLARSAGCQLSKTLKEEEEDEEEDEEETGGHCLDSHICNVYNSMCVIVEKYFPLCPSDKKVTLWDYSSAEVYMWLCPCLQMDKVS